LRLLAVRLSASCVSKVLAGKPQKHVIFTSCGSLRILAALLACALFLGCTVCYVRRKKKAPNMVEKETPPGDMFSYFKCLLVKFPGHLNGKVSS